jgi:hypothetical protein
MESECITLGVDYKHSRPYHPAVSTSARKELSELFRWFHKTEGFARTVVEASRDAVQVMCRESREVGSTWHVLAQQSVRVLVRAPLPGAVRVAEVDLDAGVDREVDVAVYLFALVPSKRLEEFLGSRLIALRIAASTCAGKRPSGRCRSIT